MVDVRLVSYNVHGLGSDRAALIEVVRRLRPDVLVAQEAPRRWRWRAKCAAFARETGLVYVAGGRTGGGNLVLVAHRIRVRAVIEHRLVQPWGDPMRGLAGAVLEAGTGAERARFAVFGVHLALNAKRRARDAVRLTDRIRESAGLGEAASGVAAPGGTGELPRVLAGDLNEPPGGPAWQRFAAAGFVDPLQGKGNPTFRAMEPKTRIDAVLATAQVGVRTYAVIDGADQPETLDPTEPPEPAEPADSEDGGELAGEKLADLVRRASDHLPVLTTLRFPPGPGGAAG